MERVTAAVAGPRIPLSLAQVMLSADGATLFVLWGNCTVSAHAAGDGSASPLGAARPPGAGFDDCDGGEVAPLTLARSGGAGRCVLALIAC
jgi:hypothetical protein